MADKKEENGKTIVKVVKTGGIWTICWVFTLGLLFGLTEDPVKALESVSGWALVLGVGLTYILWPFILGAVVGELFRVVTAALS